MQAIEWKLEFKWRRIEAKKLDELRRYENMDDA